MFVNVLFTVMQVRSVGGKVGQSTVYTDLV